MMGIFILYMAKDDGAAGATGCAKPTDLRD